MTHKYFQTAKSPARVYAGIKETLRLGGAFVWYLPSAPSYLVVVGKQKQRVAAVLVKRGNDLTYEEQQWHYNIISSDRTKGNLQAIAMYLYGVANSDALTQTLLKKAAVSTKNEQSGGEE